MQKRPGRKALIILSDGVDTTSNAALDAAINAAHRADTLIYTIHFLDEDILRRSPMAQGHPEARIPFENGRRVLERMSDETGGASFDSRRPLDGVFDAIEQELRNQYSIGYKPGKAATPGEFRKVRLTTTTKGYTVQTRKGYFG